MNDVSFCDGVGCKIKEFCKRFREYSNRDEYSHTYWYVEPKYSEGKCVNFMKQE